jgi:sRNA-binding carbon storage regulator CsrA
MLVLTRKKRQTIVIGDPGGGAPLLLITVLEVARGRVQIGFTTTAVNTAAIPIQRGEMWTGGVELASATCQANGDGAARRKVTAENRARERFPPVTRPLLHHLRRRIGASASDATQP